MFMRDHLGVTAPIYCTKIASKLVRTYTDRHGLKDLTKEVLGRDISKVQHRATGARPSSPTRSSLTRPLTCCYLHALKAKLNEMLVREGRVEIAQSCFDFLPTRAALDLAGWEEVRHLRARMSPDAVNKLRRSLDGRRQAISALALRIRPVLRSDTHRLLGQRDLYRERGERDRGRAKVRRCWRRRIGRNARTLTAMAKHE